MSWAAILGLAAGAYARKALGFSGLSRISLRGPALAVIQLLPAALLAALIALQLADGGDARLVATRVAGVAVGAAAVWRRAPLVIALVAAGGTAAVLRLIT